MRFGFLLYIPLQAASVKIIHFRCSTQIPILCRRGASPPADLRQRALLPVGATFGHPPRPASPHRPVPVGADALCGPLPRAIVLFTERSGDRSLRVPLHRLRCRGGACPLPPIRVHFRPAPVGSDALCGPLPRAIVLFTERSGDRSLRERSSHAIVPSAALRLRVYFAEQCSALRGSVSSCPNLRTGAPPFRQGGLCAVPRPRSPRACSGRRPRRPAASSHRSVYGAIRGSLPTRPASSSKP